MQVINETNDKNWKVDEDGVQISSVSNVLIPWLGISLEAWFEVEENQNWWTNQQAKVYENFLNLGFTSKQEFIEKLHSIYSKELEKGRIEETQFEEILEST